MRIVFMGTPEFAVPTLSALIDAGHDMAAVYTQPPRPAGRRGLKTTPSPIQSLADNRGLEVRTPTSLKSDAEIDAFAALAADVCVVVAYGMILPPRILDAPIHGCFNLHASKLPRWRGAAPIHRAIMAGDEETAVMVMKMDAGLDTGDIALSTVVPIGKDQTTGALHDVLAQAGAPLVVEAMAQLERGALKLTPQPSDGVTYAAKIEKSETQIDFQAPATAVHNHIRGLSPFPGAWFAAADGSRVKVLAARPADRDDLQGRPATVGCLVGTPLTVACGEGAVALERVQRAGKTAVDAHTYANGQGLALGDAVASQVGPDAHKSQAAN